MQPDQSGTRITETVPVPDQLELTPELFAHQAYSFPLNEADFVRLKQPDPLKIRAGDRLLFPSLFWLAGVFANWVADRTRSPNWWAVGAGVLFLGVGVWAWSSAKYAPNERKDLLDRIEMYFKNNRPTKVKT